MLFRNSVDALGTAEQGRIVASDELKSRGAKSISEIRSLNRIVLVFEDITGKNYRIIVKTRTSGTWQGTIADGDIKKADPKTYWLYVDLSISKPDFYIVPDEWMRGDINRVHSEYLQRAGGQRVHNPKSLHHAIQKSRIEQWRDRWDFIGLA